ncbi:MAG: hypothetical protein J6Z11_05385 [Candidatus Riflebacteria bacterium]|nr:hypothetical protein [Candidatus Riflebacteria bacterium]
MNEFLMKFDDSLNAILVKDLRQIVRGKFIWSVLLLYLTIIVLILFFSLIDADASGSIDGEFISVAMLGFLFFVCALLIPIQIGKKTGDEINDATHELLFTTTMKPASIVKGKLLGGVVTIVMMYATLAPFLMLTLFMGGVDIRNLTLGLIYSFIVSNICVLFQVHVGMSYRNLIGTSGFGNKAGAIIFQIIAWFWLAGLGSEILNGRFFRYNKSWEVWLVIFYFCAIVIFLSLILYVLTVSRLEAESSNRSYMFKGVATGIWIIGYFLTVFSETASQAWCFIVFIALIVLSFILLLDPESYSERVIKEIPANPVVRFIKFPFFTGMANSLCWIFSFAILNYMYGFFVSAVMSPYSSDFISSLTAMASVLAYAMAYFLLSNSIRKLFFGNENKGVVIGIFVFIILVAIILPIFVSNLVPYGLRDIVYIVSPFAAFINFRRGVSIAVIVSFIFLVITLAFNSFSLVAQINSYFTKKVDYKNKPFNKADVYKDFDIN